MGVKIFCMGAALILACHSALAQTVQLPTLQTFSVNTSVLVPDRGQTYLGGITRSRSRSSIRGLPGISGVPFANRLTKNRGLALERSATSAITRITTPSSNLRGVRPFQSLSQVPASPSLPSDMPTRHFPSNLRISHILPYQPNQVGSPAWSLTA